MSIILAAVFWRFLVIQRLNHRASLRNGCKMHRSGWTIAYASYKQQEKNPGVTEIHEMPGRGHVLTIDHGWREVAETTLAFIARQGKERGRRAQKEMPIPSSIIG